MRQTSVIQRENLLTLDQSLVLSRLGDLSASLLVQGNEALKAALNLH